MKKVLSAFLSFVLVLSLFVVPAIPAAASSRDNSVNLVNDYPGAASAETPRPAVTVSTLAELQAEIDSSGPEGKVITLKAGVYNQTSAINVTDKQNITIQGETQNSRDTVLKGLGINNEGFWINFKANNSHYITVRDLSLTDSYYHAVQVNDGSDYFYAYNLYCWDNGEGGFKSTTQYYPNQTYCDYGIIENCVIGETTQAYRDVIEGIDLIASVGWIIRGNTIVNCRSKTEYGFGFFAKHNSQDTLVENNVLINCGIALSFGGGGGGNAGDPINLYRDGDYEYWHRGGIMRNNIVIRTDFSDSGYLYDVGVYINHSRDAEIYNNTVMDYYAYGPSIDFRDSTSSGGKVYNNILAGGIQYREGAPAPMASNNIINAKGQEAFLFVDPTNADPYARDYHLLETAVTAIDRGIALSAVWSDFDGVARPQGDGFDIGAYEYRDTGVVEPPIVLPEEPTYVLESEGGNLFIGDVVAITPKFDVTVDSNAAILNFCFDPEKLSFAGFAPADGVSALYMDIETPGVATVCLMVNDYNTTEYGTLYLEAVTDLVGAEDWYDVYSTALLAVRLPGDEEAKAKTSFEASYVYAAVPSTPGLVGDSDFNGVLNLIDLSNILDVYGMTSEHPEWDRYKHMDYVQDGAILIEDIVFVAMLVLYAD